MTSQEGRNDRLMVLSVTQIQKVKDSWSLFYTDVEKQGLEIMLRMHEQMFEVMSASFEGDFKRTDKESQISDVQRTHGIKMMKGINNIVINLDNAGQLRDNIRLLASDHIDKGITAHDIKMGLEILQGLIHESLGEMYDVITKEAWRQCSNIICTILDAEMVSSSSA